MQLRLKSFDIPHYFIALTPAMAPKKQRQSYADGVMPAAKAVRFTQGPEQLVACARKWGNAAWVFGGAIISIWAKHEITL